MFSIRLNGISDVAYFFWATLYLTRSAAKPLMSGLNGAASVNLLNGDRHTLHSHTL